MQDSLIKELGAIVGPGHILTTPEERWGVIGYVRALQLSQHARAAQVPPETMQKLQGEAR